MLPVAIPAEALPAMGAAMDHALGLAAGRAGDHFATVTFQN